MADESPIRILLVEDEPDDHLFVRRLLEKSYGEEFDLTWARNGREAREFLAQNSFDLLLLDQELGAETGLDLISVLPIPRRTPVVVLTGHSNPRLDLEASAAGASDFLIKGDLTATLLERSIRYVLVQSRAQERIREAKQRYRNVLEAAGAIVWQADPETFRFSLVSPEAEALLGYPVEAWLEDAGFWADHVHPDDRDWVVPMCQKASQRGEPHVLEYRMIAVDGRVVWLHDTVRVQTIRDRPQLVGVMVDITEQKRAEAQLRLQEQAVQSVSEGILITDARQPDNPIIQANAAFCRMTGYSEAEVMGRNCRFLQGPASDPRMVEEIGNAVRERKSFAGEILNYRKDGSMFWNRLSLTPLFDAAGELTHFVGVQQDVTEHHRLIDQVRAERSRLQAAFEQAPAFMTLLSGPDHVLEIANQRIYELVGRRELVGRPLREAIPELVGQGILERLDRVFESGEPFVVSEMTLRLAPEPGATPQARILDFVFQPMLEGDGSVEGVLVHGIDVTDEAKAREELRSAKAHYERLVSTSPEAIYALDAAGDFIEINEAGEKLLERTASDLIGSPFRRVVAPEDLPIAEEVFRTAMSGRTIADETEIRIVRPSGERRLLCISIAPIHDDGVEGVHGIARDVTAERERDLRANMLTAALDHLSEGVSLATSDGTFLYSNAAHKRLLGYEDDDPAGAETFLPDKKAERELREAVLEARQYGSWSGRFRRRRVRDGEMLDIEALLGIVDGPDGELILTILRDASDAIAREQQLRRAERLASVGTLVGGVAHELNNPLHAIRNFADLMLMEERNPEDREALEIIEREADRAAKIVSDLRLIARESQSEDTQREAVDLNDVVHHAIRVRRYSLDTRDIEVQTDLQDDLPPIHALRADIEQVLLNLIMNAEQAMDETERDRRLSLRTRSAGGHATLTLTDNGSGIAAENLPRIFDAFFTTKQPGEGTGLGLSLVHSIIAEHDGEIRVNSMPGRGTTFRIDLPFANGQAAAGAVEPSADPAASSLRVLVVDDEEAVRRVSVRLLERLGYDVRVAGDGNEALQMLDAMQFDVILSDLRMPGLSGEQLFERLREQGRGLERRVVFLTGDTRRDPAPQSPFADEVPFLTKPIRLRDLCSALERVAGTPLNPSTK